MSSEACRQVVAFRLGSEVYGIDIGRVHTVITPQTITPIPKTPAHVLGVMNLRGRIVPVLDLKLRLGLPATDAADITTTRIIIVETDSACAGIVVDGVSEVLNLPESSIQPPTAFIAPRALEFITGIGRMSRPAIDGLESQEQLVLLLNVDHAISSEREQPLVAA